MLQLVNIWLEWEEQKMQREFWWGTIEQIPLQKGKKRKYYNINISLMGIRMWGGTGLESFQTVRFVLSNDSG